MARLVVLYKTPTDPVAFKKEYFEVHVPLAKKIPGLRKFEVSEGPVNSPAGPSPYHFVATLHFDSVDALVAGRASPEGLATGAHARTIATGGVELLIFETSEV